MKENRKDWNKAWRHYERSKLLEKRGRYAEALEAAGLALQMCPIAEIEKFPFQVSVEAQVGRLSNLLNSPLTAPGKGSTKKDVDAS
jgi:hypothetical protein